MPPTTRHGELDQQVDLAEHNDLSHHGDFDPEQAAMLQDLAKNGAPDAHLSDSPEIGANGGHLDVYSDPASNDMNPNGVLPVLDHA